MSLRNSLALGAGLATGCAPLEYPDGLACAEATCDNTDRFGNLKVRDGVFGTVHALDQALSDGQLAQLDGVIRLTQDNGNSVRWKEIRNAVANGELQPVLYPGNAFAGATDNGEVLGASTVDWQCSDYGSQRADDICFSFKPNGEMADWFVEGSTAGITLLDGCQKVTELTGLGHLGEAANGGITWQFKLEE